MVEDVFALAVGLQIERRRPPRLRRPRPRTARCCGAPAGALDRAAGLLEDVEEVVGDERVGRRSPGGRRRRPRPSRPISAIAAVNADLRPSAPSRGEALEDQVVAVGADRCPTRPASATVQATIGMPSSRYSSARALGSMSRPSARKCGRAMRDVLQPGEALALLRRQVARVGVAVAVAVQAAQDVGMVVGEPGVGIGIEADHRRSGRCGRSGSRAPAAPAARPRRTAVFSSMCTMARWPTRVRVSARVGMVSSRAGQRASRRGRRRCGRRCGPRAPVIRRQVGVVEHHRLAVGAELHVQFDAVAGRAGGLERAQRVLRRAVRATTGRGGRSAARTAAPRPRRTRSFIATSTTASTSTAKFSGRR